MSRAARRAEHIALFVYYFPPLSSSGAKRMEAMAKYFVREGRRVSVITTTKSDRDGLLSEAPPPGVTIIELDRFGRLRASPPPKVDLAATSVASAAPSLGRRLKDLVLRTSGQLIDPRMPFPMSIRYPWLAREAREVLETVDVAVGTCPPWPPLLAALSAGKRFNIPAVVDYRDQLSCCHEMPGSKLAKRLEISLDRYLTRRAAAVVAISEPLRSYYSRFHPDSLLVLNGYDEEKLEAALQRAPWRQRGDGEPLRIRYLGLITEGRVPRNLIEAMEQLHASGELPPGSVELEFYGECSLLDRLIETNYPRLRPFFRFFGAVPYGRALELIVSSDHVLFCEQMVAPLPGQEESAAGILPTKLYEYLASGRPILGNVPPDTLAGQFIRDGSARHFVAQDTGEFVRYLRSDAFWHPAPVAVEPFVQSLSREVQAKRYLEHLDRIVAQAEVTKSGT